MATDSPLHKIYFSFNAQAYYFTDSTYPNCPPPPSISFGPANTHAIGKGILAFYALYPPALLLALNLPLPCLILTRALVYEPPENEQRHRRRGRALRDLRISHGCHMLQYPSTRGHRGPLRLRRAHQNHQLPERLGRPPRKPCRPDPRVEVRPRNSY